MIRASVPILLLALAACGDDEPKGPATPADQTYTVEGTVESLPREGAEHREMSIAHEEIPEFVDREGERVGMHAMSMQFEVSPRVDLEGIEPGDRVRFTFEVRWDEQPMLWITELSEARAAPP